MGHGKEPLRQWAVSVGCGGMGASGQDPSGGCIGSGHWAVTSG